MKATDVTGVILAGGRAERMGGHDKGWVLLAGEPLIAHAVRRLRPQVAELLISANRHLDAYGRFGCRVVMDAEAGFHGPLAGILAAMTVTATPYVLTIPCDSPMPAPDYAQRMRAAHQGASTVCVACNDEGWQPVLALIPVSLKDDLASYLAGGERSVGRWLRRHSAVSVAFSDWPALFRNVNTPEELAQLEAEWTGLTTRYPLGDRDD